VFSCAVWQCGTRSDLPQDELAAFGLSDDGIFAGQVTPKWRNFMRFQIQGPRGPTVRSSGCRSWTPKAAGRCVPLPLQACACPCSCSLA